MSADVHQRERADRGDGTRESADHVCLLLLARVTHADAIKSPASILGCQTPPASVHTKTVQRSLQVARHPLAFNDSRIGASRAARSTGFARDVTSLVDFFAWQAPGRSGDRSF